VEGGRQLVATGPIPSLTRASHASPSLRPQIAASHRSCPVPRDNCMGRVLAGAPRVPREPWAVTSFRSAVRGTGPVGPATPSVVPPLFRVRATLLVTATGGPSPPIADRAPDATGGALAVRGAAPRSVSRRPCRAAPRRSARGPRVHVTPVRVSPRELGWVTGGRGRQRPAAATAARASGG